MADDDDVPTQKLPVVQYASAIFYVAEDSNFQATVMRLGDSSTQCQVDWETLPSPYEGKKFRAGRGTLVFDPGVSFLHFEVQVLADEKFDSTLQFELKLSNPVDCTLGLYLRKAAVKVLDDDTFPSNVYRQKLLADPTTRSWQQGESFNMLKRYVRFTYNSTPNSRKVLIVDQIDNMVYIWDICILRVLVNVLTGDGFHVLQDFDAQTSLVIYAIAWLLPNVITHWFSYARTTWKITGGARRVLQENLLRKYLYQDESAAFESPAVFLYSFGHDVSDLVEDGYLKFFVVMKALGELVMAFLATLWFAVEAKARKDVNVVFMALLPFLIQPVAIYLFVLCRSEGNHSLQHKLQRDNDDLLHKVDKAIECYRMVADYFTRALVVDDSLADIQKVNGTIANLAGVMANNMAFVEWVNNITVLVWIVIGGLNAVRGNFTEMHEAKDDAHYFGVSLGTFVAVNQLIKSNGKQFEAIFDVYLTISNTYPALWRVVRLMNKPTDSQRRLQILQFRLNRTMDELNKAKVNHPDVAFPMDEVPIELSNVSFTYHNADLDSLQVSGFSRKIKQGTSVCISGVHGCGKSTLMRIIGAVLPQTSGSIFIPSHLRVLHVSADACLWPGTVAENLFFGECSMHSLLTDQYRDLDAASKDRGRRICKRLQFPKELQKEAENLESTTEVEGLFLTLSQMKLIHIARALIINPEVLVIHQPTLSLGKDKSHVVSQVLRSFVKERGVELSTETRHLRRPRTLIFSTYDRHVQDFADEVILMDKQDNFNF